MNTSQRFGAMTAFALIFTAAAAAAGYFSTFIVLAVVLAAEAAVLCGMFYFAAKNTREYEEKTAEAVLNAAEGKRAIFADGYARSKLSEGLERWAENTEKLRAELNEKNRASTEQASAVVAYLNAIQRGDIETASRNAATAGAQIADAAEKTRETLRLFFNGIDALTDAQGKKAENSKLSGD